MNRNRLLLVLVLVLALGLSGCANIFSFFKKQPTEIVVTPAEVEIAVDEELELTAVVKDKKGKEMNVKAADIKWVIEDVEEAEGAEEGGEDPGPVAELSAATGAKVKVKGLRVGEAKITVSYDDITAEVPVTVTEAEEEEPEEPEEPEAFFEEDFNVADVATLFSATHKALPGDPNKPMLIATSGETKMAIEDGTLKIGDARFAIGMSRAVDDLTTSNDTDPGGVLDLTKKYRITIEYTKTDGNDSKEFQIFVDNNTSNAGNSIHGNDSRIWKSALKDLPESPIVIESTVGTKNSFVQVRVEKEAYVWIDSIRIEYVDEEE